VHQALVDSVKASMVLLPLLRDNVAAASKFVDMRDFEYVDFLVQVGAVDIVVDAKAQESVNADGSSASDITGSNVTQIAATDDNRMVVISVRKATTTKRYVGVLVTVGDGATGANVSVAALRYGKAGELPVTQETAGADAYATAQVVRV